MEGITEKQRFWRTILHSSEESSNSRTYSTRNSSCFGSVHQLGECVIVQVHDGQTSCLYQTQQGHLSAIAKIRARSILTSNPKCKLLCEYIKNCYDISDNWRLRFVIYLDNGEESPVPRYFVEFTEYLEPNLLKKVREVSAKVNIQVNKSEPFGLQWDLAITRGDNETVTMSQ